VGATLRDWAASGKIRSMLRFAGAFEVLAVALQAATATGGGTEHNPYVDPAWSPDGKRVAFVDRGVPGSGGDLFVANADGTGVSRLTTSSADTRDNRYSARTPDWSPDGRTIAFGYGYDEIDAVTPDGSGFRTLAHGIDPAWSPRGRKLAFAQGGETEGWSLYVVNPDGSHRTLVAKPSLSLSYEGPTWSPDGERLAFSIGSAPDTGAQVPNALGSIDGYRSRVRLLRTGGYHPALADWSPDGRRIAFSVNGHGIVVLDLRTNRLRRISARGIFVRPRWSPDGKRIAFAWHGAIYVIQADGSGLHRLIG
jgi:Tol biopolymer transport system component